MSRLPTCTVRGLWVFFLGPGGGGFYRYEDDYDDSEDEWDCQWNRMHEQEEAEKNQEAADVDAFTDEIKRIFRKKAALKYHPISSALRITRTG
jgi:hypothetical protein